MSILIGGNKANKMYWGSTPVSKVFWGSTKVWPSTKPRTLVMDMSYGEYESYSRIFYADDTIPTSGRWGFTRPDGITTSIDDIAFGNGMFVAGGSTLNFPGDTALFYSRDGLTWTKATPPAITPYMGYTDAGINHVTFGGGKFIAVARSSKEYLYSSDGITWTKANLPFSTYPYATIIKFCKDKFICARSGSITDGIYYSTNGTSWTACTIPTDANHCAATQYYDDPIAYGNNKFIIASAETGYTNKCLVSSDGITWSWGGTQEYSIATMAYGAGLFVGIVRSYDPPHRILTSPDGTTWTTRTLYGYGSGSNAKIAWCGNSFVVTGQNGETSFTSTNGTSWTRNNAAFNGADGSYAVCYGEVAADA